MLVEIDLSNNQALDTPLLVIPVILSKKEILVLALRSTPLALKTQSAEQFFKDADEQT